MCAPAVQAAPASALQWNLTKLAEPSTLLFGASCPSPTLCAVVGSNGTLAISTDPTGGTATWGVTHFNGLEEVHQSDPKATFAAAQVRGVSCPSTEFCAAMSRQGYVYASTSPASGAPAWGAVALQGEHKPRVHVYGVSCPSTSLCVGVASGGRIVTSTKPIGATAWSVSQLGAPLELTGVSCPTESLCVAVGSDGSVISTTDPGGGAPTWIAAPGSGSFGVLQGLSCSSPSLCVTGNAADLFVSTIPAGPAASWQAIPDVTPLQTTAFSCPADSACAAVDDNADIITSTDPTGGSAAWSFTNAIPIPPNGMFGISCPTTEFCAAAGTGGQILTSTSPFAGTRPANVRSRKGHRRHTVRITHHPKRVTRIDAATTGVRFRFRPIGKARGFLCKLDGGRFSRCRSPKRYRVRIGRHAFRVKAEDPGGIDQTASVFRFRVLRRR
ncbi:MAG TPA: hypothetical protein VH476_05725 [Solirubrobacterales bacterium]